MRIEADRDRCASSGMCVLTAPEVFDQDEEDGRVLVLAADVPADEESDVRQAVRLCPSRALKIADEPG